MQLEQIVSKVQKSLPGTTKEAVESALKKLNRRPEQIGDNNIPAIVKAIGSSAIKPVENKLVTVDTQEDQQQGLEKHQRQTLDKPQEIVIEEKINTDRRDEALKTHLLSIDAEIRADENAEALALVDSVLPEFLRWRLGQSPDRVAQKVDQLCEEVVGQVSPKFQTLRTNRSESVRQSAASILSEFKGV